MKYIYNLMLVMLLTSCQTYWQPKYVAIEANYNHTFPEDGLQSYIEKADIGKKIILPSNNELVVMKHYNSATGAYCRQFLYNGNKDIACRKGNSGWYMVGDI